MILMNEDLRDKLVAHYERVKMEVSNLNEGFDGYILCRDNFVDNGVCYCARMMFDTPIVNCSWVNRQIKKNNRNDFWCNLIWPHSTINIIITLLQTRIDILKQFPN